MGEEQQLILKMLEEGKITVDETERLLSALSIEKESPRQPDFMKGFGDVFEDFGRKFESFFKHDFSGFFGGDVQEYAAPTETQQFETGEQAELRMEHSHGSIQIASWDEPTISVEATKRVRVGSSELASELLDAIEVNGQLNGNVLTLKTIYPRDKSLWQGKRQAEVQYTISVPRHTEVQLSTRHGNLTIQQLTAPVTLESTHGNIKLQDIQNRLQIDGIHGNVDIQNVQGPVEMKRRHGNLTLQEISSNVTIHGEHGNVSIENSQGDLHLQRAHGNIRVHDFEGNFDILHRHGPVHVEGTPGTAGECRIEGMHSPIHLCLPQTIEAYIHASTHHGRIHSDFDGQYVNEKLGQELHTGDEGLPLKIELKTHHGDIRIEKRGDENDE